MDLCLFSTLYFPLFSVFVLTLNFFVVDQCHFFLQEYLFERKVKATDRTKTPEEIAKEEAEKLHELETRRLARMNGDFDEDDLSDISDDEEGGGGRKRRRKSGKLKSRKKQKGESGGDDLGDSDDDDDNKEDENEVRFTADGLVYIDKQGNVVGKVGEENQDEDEETSSENEESEGSDEESKVGSDHSESGTDSDDSEEEEEYDNIQFTKGMKVQGNYHASEQYQGKENWYDGTITGIRKDDDGNTVYDVTYDDGDFEEGMDRENVRPIPLSKEEKEQQKTEESEAAVVKKKKQKAKLRAK